jgi:DNA repair exonuclease SbcCD nuclease subunit
VNEIVIVGDVHEGRAYDFRVNPLISVSDRTLDLHKNLVRAAEFAVENKAVLFVLLGDLFDRTNVAPIFREYVRQDVIEPLGKAGVRVLILAGNHDQPRVFQRGTSVDDLSGYPHVTIFRKPTSLVETVSGRTISFIIMPFLYPESILDQLGKKAEDIPEDQRIIVSQEVLKEFLHKSSETEADAKILLAHYYFEGAELGNPLYPEAEMGELEFTPSMIPQNIDVAFFGHVHLHQTRDARRVPVVLVGAVERIDWGEKLGKKGFVTLDPATMKWEFRELPTREMLEIRVKIEEGEKDPTARILGKIPSDLGGKMVRLYVELPLAMRPLIRDNEVGERLSPAFDRKVSWLTPSAEPVRSGEMAKALANHYGLLESFLDLNFAKHPHKDALAKEGRNILREVLGQ